MKRNNLAVVSLIFLCMNFQCIKNINHDTNDVIITEFSLNSKFTDGNIYHFDVLKKDLQIDRFYFECSIDTHNKNLP